MAMYLFGFQVKGTGAVDSDVDLAILLKDNSCDFSLILNNLPLPIMNRYPELPPPMNQESQRDIYSLFGIPFDNLTTSETIQRFRSLKDRKTPLVWSTVNVNWVVQASKDEEFYKAILASDIVTLDGKTLLWLSKLLGYPMTEVVTGSGTIQDLHDTQVSEQDKLTIFFFGGNDDVGQVAMQKVNMNQGGLRAVGAINPGYGTVEEMSTDAIITAINKARPDILLVALGAKKGVAWIEHNRHRLNAKVISHLGATVNFLAGSVRRAPALFRNLGLEWVWRIVQEPKLFARYFGDGIGLLSLLLRGKLRNCVQK